LGPKASSREGDRGDMRFGIFRLDAILPEQIEPGIVGVIL
jgi:hypothetical protein